MRNDMVARTYIYAYIWGSDEKYPKIEMKYRKGKSP